MRQNILTALLTLFFCTVIPAFAMAETDTALTSDSALRSGFSVNFQIGPDVTIDRRMQMGSTALYAPVAGVGASLDIGYKFKYFGIYLSTNYRADFSIKNIDKDFETSFKIPSAPQNTYHITSEYAAIKAGEWSGDIFGIGLMFTGFIPVNDRLILTLGIGTYALFQVSLIDHEFSQDSLLLNIPLKLSVGLNVPVTDQIMLGIAMNYETTYFQDHRIQPSFSLIYTY